MLTYLQAVVLGAVQGVTELFPVSSLGHSVILPKLLGWNVEQTDPLYLIFLVAMHGATALVLFLFFWEDWKKIVSGFFRSLIQREIRSDDSYAKLAWLLVVATVPAGALGLLFEDSLKKLFASPQIVSVFLLLNGLMLLGAELLRRKLKENNAPVGSDDRISKVSWVATTKIGVMQCLALLPGFSRTGATITGGLLVGLSHEDAARFSFLLATPIIGAAAFLKLPELLGKSGQVDMGPIIVGSVFAGIFAYLSVKFLTKYFETKKLWPFGVYCLILGLVVFLLTLRS